LKKASQACKKAVVGGGKQAGKTEKFLCSTRESQLEEHRKNFMKNFYVLQGIPSLKNIEKFPL